jgi:hypothetical protein
MVSVVVDTAASLLPVVAFVTAMLDTAVDDTVPVIVELLMTAPSKYGSSYATPTGFVFVAIVVSFKNRGRSPHSIYFRKAE